MKATATKDRPAKMAGPPNTLRPNSDWASLPLFRREGWVRMAFGAFAESVNVRVEPADAAEEVYVGLDDLDSGCLHIRRWGKGSDVIGTKLRFRKGDLIFGRRRAYQRKLAVAEMDGICSAHALVVRAKPDMVRPEFLPFLMMSDKFMRRAVEISVGSLSPTINWTTLKHEEFDLPPLDQQRRIAEILWAVDESLAVHEKVGQDLEAFQTSISDAALRGDANPNHSNGASWSSWPIARVEDVCERISVGIVVTPSKYYRPAGVRCFRSANVRRGFIEDKDWIFISDEAHQQHSKSILRAGDVLVVRSGVFAGMSCVVPPEYDNVNCIDVVFATPQRGIVEPEWLSNFINSSFGQVEIKRGERGLAQKHFGVDAMRNTPLPLPPLTEQRRHLAKMKEAADAASLNQKHCEELRSLSAAVVTTIVP